MSIMKERMLLLRELDVMPPTRASAAWARFLKIHHVKMVRWWPSDWS